MRVRVKKKVEDHRPVLIQKLLKENAALKERVNKLLKQSVERETLISKLYTRSTPCPISCLAESVEQT